MVQAPSSLGWVPTTAGVGFGVDAGLGAGNGFGMSTNVGASVELGVCAGVGASAVRYEVNAIAGSGIWEVALNKAWEVARALERVLDALETGLCPTKRAATLTMATP